MRRLEPLAGHRRAAHDNEFVAGGVDISARPRPRAARSACPIVPRATEETDEPVGATSQRSVWFSCLCISRQLTLACLHSTPHHLRRRSICGGEARDGWVGQQINVRRGRVISLSHVGKLQQVRLTRGLPHDLRLAAPPPGDRRSRRRGSLSGTTLRSLQLHRRTGRPAA